MELYGTIIGIFIIIIDIFLLIFRLFDLSHFLFWIVLIIFIPFNVTYLLALRKNEKGESIPRKMFEFLTNFSLGLILGIYCIVISCYDMFYFFIMILFFVNVFVCIMIFRYQKSESRREASSNLT